MGDADRSNDDDAERLRLDFAAFMLGGKKSTEEEEVGPSLSPAPSNKSKKKKKKKKKSLGGGGGNSGAAAAATPPKTPSSSSCGGGDANESSPSLQTVPKQPTISKSDKKRYYQLVRSFSDKVQHTWFDADDRLLSILQNVASIRGRLPLERKLLQSSTSSRGGGGGDGGVPEEDEWKCYGLLGKPKELPFSFHLQTADVELALSHDLTQHEKMLAGMRSLLSELAECQDALGRQLDVLLKFHLECTSGIDGAEDEGEEDVRHMEHMVECLSEVYGMLSMELYRKQISVASVFESTDDVLLGSDGGEGKGNSGKSGDEGLQAARRCCKSWPRGCEESCVDEDLVSQVMKLGQKFQ